MPEEIKKSSKNIDAAFEEWLAPYAKTEEYSRSQLETKYIPIDDNQLKAQRQSLFDAVDITAKTLVSELMNYCAGHGGTKTLAICRQSNFSHICEDGRKNRVSTPSLFGSGNFVYRGSGDSLYFACRQGNEIQLEVGVGHSTTSFDKSTHKLFVRMDSPLQRARNRTLSQRDLDDYHLLRNPLALDFGQLRDLCNRFEGKDDPESLLPRAKQRRDELVQERVTSEKALPLQLRQKMDIATANAERLEQEAQKKREDFLATVGKGSLVCQTVQASINQPTGAIVLGQPQTVQIQGKANIAGYVNEKANRKLQIQISSIVFRWLDESSRSHEQDLDTIRHSGGSTSLRVNGVIWDSESAWDYCK